MDVAVSPPGVTSRLVTLRSGKRLGIAEFGAPGGLPVLAFHGAPASRLMFDVADDAARQLGLRLIAFDRPGYGLSPLDYGATLASRTEIFAELPDALGLDRFAVIAVSGGGPYAVAMAARLGQRIQALGLVSPLGPVADVAARSVPDPVHLSMAHRMFFLDLPRHTWMLRFNAEVAARSFRAAPRLVASTFLHLLPETDREILSRPEVSHSMIEMTLEATRHGIGGGIADLEIYGEPWYVDYRAISAPCVLWQGLADTIVPVAVSKRLGALVPGCKVERIARAGHFWIYEHIPDVLGHLRALAI